MKEIFNFSDNNSYNLSSGTNLSRPIVHKTHYGTESITNLGAKIWELIPQNIKVETSLSSFKNKVEKWIPKNRLCRLGRTYVGQDGINVWLIKESCKLK